MHNIVVIGGNFSGVAIAQHLLKQVLPLVNNPSAQYKVILISPSAQTYFKVGAPRLLASDAIPVEKAFASIPDGFRQYSSDEFAFVQGEAVQVNDSTKAVTVQAADKTEKSVAFGSLVIATGTTSVKTTHTSILVVLSELTTIYRPAHYGHYMAPTKSQSTLSVTRSLVSPWRSRFS